VDAAKAKRNVAKHGVTFDEAVTAFADPLATTYATPSILGMSFVTSRLRDPRAKDSW